MTRFLLYILGLLVFLPASVFWLYYRDIPHEAQIFESIPNKLQIVNLGTSHGYDFDYRMARLNGRNQCIGANTLYYDLQTYRYLLQIDLLNPDALVILPISYFSFGDDENQTDMLPKRSLVDFYYTFLPAEFIYEYSFQKDAQVFLYNAQQNFRQLAFGTRKRPLHARGPNKFVNKRVEQHFAEKPVGYEAIAKARAEDHKSSIGADYVKRNQDYLATLIIEIKASGRTPLLVTTPYHAEYNKHFSEQWLSDNYFSLIHQVAEKLNVPYYDYSHHPDICQNRELFSDSDHLSKEGKKVFNKLFFQDIDEYVKDLSRAEKRPKKYLLK